MRRMGDGRTVVRSLSASGGHDRVQPAPTLSTEEDAADRLAEKRSARFLKRKLGRGVPGGGPGGEEDAANANGKKKDGAAARSEDDPLGLGDPAFLPGGEFAHLAGLTGKKKRRRGGSGGGVGGAAGAKTMDKKSMRGDGECLAEARNVCKEAVADGDNASS